MDGCVPQPDCYYTSIWMSSDDDSGNDDDLSVLFLSDPSLTLALSCLSLTHSLYCWNLTDVTLALYYTSATFKHCFVNPICIPCFHFRSWMSLRKSILGSVVCFAKILLVKIYLQRQTKSANKYFAGFLRGRLIGGCWECWCWNAKLRWDDGALATGDVGGPDSSSSSPSLLLQHYFNVISQRYHGVRFQQSFNVGWQIYFAAMTSNVFGVLVPKLSRMCNSESSFYYLFLPQLHFFQPFVYSMKIENDLHG